MFTEITKLEGVFHSYILDGEYLYCLEDSSRVAKYDMSGDRSLLWRTAPIEGAGSIKLVNGSLVCNSGYTSRAIDPSSGETLDEHPYRIISGFDDCELQVGVAKTGTTTRDIALISNFREEVWRREYKVGKTLYLSGSRIFNTEKRNCRRLLCFSREAFDREWEFDVYPYGKYVDVLFSGREKGGCVYRILGVIHGLLWAELDNHSIIALDEARGELKHLVGISEFDKQRLMFEEERSSGWVPFATGASLDPQGKCIISLCGTWFAKVDLQETSPSRAYVDVSQTMRFHGLKANYSDGSFPFDKKYIYFCDTHLGRIGLFDRADETVVWSHDLNMKRQGIAQIASMEVMGDVWCILDRNMVLHVYKREQSAQNS